MTLGKLLHEGPVSKRGLKNSVYASLVSGLVDGLRLLEDAMPLAGISRLSALVTIEPSSETSMPPLESGETKARAG